LTIVKASHLLSDAALRTFCVMCNARKRKRVKKTAIRVCEGCRTRIVG
jgi:hypothetical protein